MGSITRGVDQHQEGEIDDVGRRDFATQDPTQIRQDHNIYNNGAKYDNIPRTVNTRPDPPTLDPVGAETEAFMCPKCNKEFRNMTLLTRYLLYLLFLDALASLRSILFTECQREAINIEKKDFL